MKAVALFSGGLDSILAIKLIQKQGIDVIAVSFRSPFFVNDEKKKKLEKVAKKEKFKIKFIELRNDYLRLVKDPKYGHGRNINPCIDCHAFMLRKAKKYADDIKAKFIFTGEVLNERPMSQNLGSLNIVAKEARLKGKILRPLSAKLLEKTEAEERGYVDRSKLLDINGRSRKKQIFLAKKFKLREFENPAGGCLLTCEGYAKKLKDLFRHSRRIDRKEVELLKIGRHFRFGSNKIIVGRNKEDNEVLEKVRAKMDYIFMVEGFQGPITLLKGKKTKDAIRIAASLTARYSDANLKKIKVKYGQKKINKKVFVQPICDKDIEIMRI